MLLLRLFVAGNAKLDLNLPNSSERLFFCAAPIDSAFAMCFYVLGDAPRRHYGAPGSRAPIFERRKKK